MNQAVAAPCPKCQLKYQCICSHLPKCTSPAHIALLMHENEQDRETNTGRWLLKGVTPSSCHIWQRTEPCPRLVELIQDPANQAYILFPSQESISVERAHMESKKRDKTSVFIVLDGTWQEAKKMLRRSAWLKEIPTTHITPQQASNYQLRRNQDKGHLCTIEVGCELLASLGHQQGSDNLRHFFDHYMQVYKADKSGHTFQG